MDFRGYKRENGSVGVRNHVIVLPTVGCANRTAVEIASTSEKAIPLTHNHNCIRFGSDHERAKRTLIGFGKNPNIHSVLVVGTGCSPFDPYDLVEEIEETKKPVKAVSLKDSDYDETIEKGKEFIRKMDREASEISRESCKIENLTLGVKCGGSSAFSAVASNPAVGKAVDMLIEEGGTAIFTETAEILGAEEVLYKRAANSKVAQQIKDTALNLKQKINDCEEDILGSEPTPGNIQAGLSTLEEKSLGAIAKSGSSPLKGVLKHGGKPRGKGLYFMDGTAKTPEVFAGMFSAGAQIQIFSLGGGPPARIRGLPAYPGSLGTLPVVKVFSSPEVKDEKDYFDIYAGGIIEGNESIDEVGERIFEKLLETALGKLTITETRGKEYTEPIQLYYTGLLM